MLKKSQNFSGSERAILLVNGPWQFLVALAASEQELGRKLDRTDVACALCPSGSELYKSISMLVQTVRPDLDLVEFDGFLSTLQVDSVRTRKSNSVLFSSSMSCINLRHLLYYLPWSRLCLFEDGLAAYVNESFTSSSRLPLNRKVRYYLKRTAEHQVYTSFKQYTGQLNAARSYFVLECLSDKLSSQSNVVFIDPSRLKVLLSEISKQHLHSFRFEATDCLYLGDNFFGRYWEKNVDYDVLWKSLKDSVEWLISSGLRVVYKPHPRAPTFLGECLAGRFGSQFITIPDDLTRFPAEALCLNTKPALTVSVMSSSLLYLREIFQLETRNLAPFFPGTNVPHFDLPAYDLVTSVTASVEDSDSPDPETGNV